MRNNKDNNDEQVFQEICTLLTEHEINYWVCHGTLLGIIREARLLPWDHDIDFAVWDAEVNKEEIVEIFKVAGYKEEIIFGEIDCLHFTGKNKKLDVSFYKINNNIATIKWIAPTSKFVLKMFEYFVKIISDKGSFSKIYSNRNLFKNILHYSFIQIALIIKKLLTNNAKKMLYNYLIKHLNYTGYSYPITLMKIKNIQYNGFVIPVPSESEKILELTYGKDWETPKKNYIWYEEAENLIDLRDAS